MSLDKSAKVAEVASAYSSNVMEGIVSTEARVAEILKNPHSAETHDKIEILGYGKALNLIRIPYSPLDFGKEEELLLLVFLFIKRVSIFANTSLWNR